MPFQTESGVWVVSLSSANNRENLLTDAAVRFRGAWIDCRSVVIYVEDRDRELKGE